MVLVLCAGLSPQLLRGLGQVDEHRLAVPDQRAVAAQWFAGQGEERVQPHVEADGAVLAQGRQQRFQGPIQKGRPFLLALAAGQQRRRIAVGAGRIAQRRAGRAGGTDRSDHQRDEEPVLAVVGHEGLRPAALALGAKPQVTRHVVEVVRHRGQAFLPERRLRTDELDLHHGRSSRR